MKLEANIKFKSTTRPTFGEVAAKTNKKEKSDLRFSKTIHINKETKVKLSDEDYDRLDATEKAKYKPVDTLLTEQEIEEFIGADWLIYQNLEDLIDAAQQGNPDIKNFECSIFNGKYVTDDIDEDYLMKLEAQRNDITKSLRQPELD